MASRASSKSLRIGFIHPDLGLGGAEKLIVDAAVSLQKRGHEVEIFTSRHDPARCFPETKDGTLNVQVLGGWPTPQSIFGAFSILCAISRQLHLTLLLLLQIYLPSPGISLLNLFLSLILVPGNDGAFRLHKIKPFDIIIIDQLSTAVPVIRWIGQTRVIFYCHFPDKLLAGGWEIAVDANGDAVGAIDPRKKNRGAFAVFKGLLKRVYRLPFDYLEELTTGEADVVLANSEFTSRVYSRAFPSLRNPPVVVYPCIDTSAYTVDMNTLTGPDVDLLKSPRKSLISLNRFEGKKNVHLALEAFNGAREVTSEKLRIVIAGGYDDQLPDNVNTLRSLKEICDKLSLQYATIDPLATKPPPDVDVLFLLNFSNAQRSYLLLSPSSLALLYTPQNEHFGIVPIEAMACGLPVLAIDNGGPVETIVDKDANMDFEDATGILRPPSVHMWTKALMTIIELTPEKRRKVAAAGKRRVAEKFSLGILGSELDQACREAVGLGKIGVEDPFLLILGTMGMVFVGLVTVLIVLRYSSE